MNHDHPGIVSIDHVQLAMPQGEEAAARQFYAGTLGFEEVPKPPELAKRGGLWFRRGSVALHLGVERDFRAAKKAHPALRCSGYDAMLVRLRSSGVEVIDDGSVFENARH